MAVTWDIRTVPKVDLFTGKDEDWNEWAFSFRSYVYMLGSADLLEQASNSATAPELVDMTDDMQRQGEMLYHVLVQFLKGKARRIAMASERGNGFKLW